MHLYVYALIVEKRPWQLLLDEKAQRRLTVVADSSVHIVGVVGLVAGGIIHLHVQQGLLGVHLTENVLAGVNLIDAICSRVDLRAPWILLNWCSVSSAAKLA